MKSTNSNTIVISHNLWIIRLSVQDRLDLHFSLIDKHPQLNEFLTQIKNTPDLSNLFESIQKDSNTGAGGEGSYSGYTSGAMSMDLS